MAVFLTEKLRSLLPQLSHFQKICCKAPLQVNAVSLYRIAALRGRDCDLFIECGVRNPLTAHNDSFYQRH